MLALIDAVAAGSVPGARVSVVVSDRADAGGVQSARERGVEAVAVERRRRPREAHEEEIIAVLRERGVTLVCLAGFMRLLSPRFIEAYRGRILNIHPSLLPAFPGLHAQRQALEYGVRWSGCTVHFVDESLDGGPVIVQRVVPVEEGDTEDSLAARILVEEHRAYPEALARIVRGDYRLVGRRVVRTEVDETPAAPSATIL